MADWITGLSGPPKIEYTNPANGSAVEVELPVPDFNRHVRATWENDDSVVLRQGCDKRVITTRRRATFRFGYESLTDDEARALIAALSQRTFTFWPRTYDADQDDDQTLERSFEVRVESDIPFTKHQMLGIEHQIELRALGARGMRFTSGAPPSPDDTGDPKPPGEAGDNPRPFGPVGGGGLVYECGEVTLQAGQALWTITLQDPKVDFRETGIFLVPRVDWVDVDAWWVPVAGLTSTSFDIATDVAPQDPLTFDYFAIPYTDGTDHSSP
ncbi:MAG: hypothetical protein GVY18_05215 [Bacteroidetes bacterium]|jgi:hypothetical protein|nr:hypothetical protein [Bacteroidota bacterium]